MMGGGFNGSQIPQFDSLWVPGISFLLLLLRKSKERRKTTTTKNDSGGLVDRPSFKRFSARTAVFSSTLREQIRGSVPYDVDDEARKLVKQRQGGQVCIYIETLVVKR